jgi:hypothetical protein
MTPGWVTLCGFPSDYRFLRWQDGQVAMAWKREKFLL